jgi:hypothetical protein
MEIIRHFFGVKSAGFHRVFRLFELIFRDFRRFLHIYRGCLEIRTVNILLKIRKDSFCVTLNDWWASKLYIALKFIESR